MDKFDRLTDPQRECLRLILLHQNSKEIARTLEISSYSVDKRVERAVAILGASSRFAAARMLAEHEGRAVYEPLVYETVDVDAAPIAKTFSGEGEPRWLVRRLFGLNPSSEQSRDARNDLTKLQRSGVILLLIVGIALFVGAMLNIAETLMTTFWSRGIDLSR